MQTSCFACSQSCPPLVYVPLGPGPLSRSLPNPSNCWPQIYLQSKNTATQKTDPNKVSSISILFNKAKNYRKHQILINYIRPAVDDPVLLIGSWRRGEVVSSMRRSRHQSPTTSRFWTFRTGICSLLWKALDFYLMGWRATGGNIAEPLWGRDEVCVCK